MSRRKIDHSSLPLICERIRFYRKGLGMEQKAFAEKIGTQANTVNNWEMGRSRPDVSLLPVICDTLGISLQQLFGLQPPGDALSEKEKRVLSGYRKLNHGDRFTVETLISTMVMVSEARRQQAGAKKVYELPLFERSLAAGVGDPTEYEGHSTPFYFYDVPWLDRADCVFRVSGDSMEPAYHDGDYVLVERIPKAPDLREGEIGVFSVANELYIKEYRSDGLHSLNPEYPVMKFNEDTRVFLIGRVLGIVDEEHQASKEDIRRYQAVASSCR